MNRTDDLISRQAAIAVADSSDYVGLSIEDVKKVTDEVVKGLKRLPSAQPESTRTFVELVAEYPDPELCTYKEYKGKPYYSIKYIENGETYVGYGTYNPRVLSQYLKEYFISSAQPEIIRCKECKHRDPEDKKCDCGHDIRWQLPRQDDWYCADAKRRTE